MNLRRIEEVPVPAIFDRPLHPYIVMLRAASPIPDPKARFALPRVVGEIPSALKSPGGMRVSSPMFLGDGGVSRSQARHGKRRTGASRGVPPLQDPCVAPG